MNVLLLVLLYTIPFTPIKGNLNPQDTCCVPLREKSEVPMFYLPKSYTTLPAQPLYEQILSLFSSRSTKLSVFLPSKSTAFRPSYVYRVYNGVSPTTFASSASFVVLGSSPISLSPTRKVIVTPKIATIDITKSLSTSISEESETTEDTSWGLPDDAGEPMPDGSWGFPDDAGEPIPDSLNAALPLSDVPYLFCLLFTLCYLSCKRKSV